MAMLFSPAQVLDLTGISTERLRHWRKEMPELAKHKGRSASFSFEELVALSIMNRLSDELGMGAASLAPHSSSIFALLTEGAVIEDEGTVLCLSKSGVTIEQLPLSIDMPVMAVIRTDIVANDLYSRVIDPTPLPQLDLPFG